MVSIYKFDIHPQHFTHKHSKSRSQISHKSIVVTPQRQGLSVSRVVSPFKCCYCDNFLNKWIPAWEGRCSKTTVLSWSDNYPGLYFDTRLRHGYKYRTGAFWFEKNLCISIIEASKVNSIRSVRAGLHDALFFGFATIQTDFCSLCILIDLLFARVPTKRILKNMVSISSDPKLVPLKTILSQVVGKFLAIRLVNSALCPSTYAGFGR